MESIVLNSKKKKSIPRISSGHKNRTGAYHSFWSRVCSLIPNRISQEISWEYDIEKYQNRVAGPALLAAITTDPNFMLNHSEFLRVAHGAGIFVPLWKVGPLHSGRKIPAAGRQASTARRDYN